MKKKGTMTTNKSEFSESNNHEDNRKVNDNRGSVVENLFGNINGKAMKIIWGLGAFGAVGWFVLAINIINPNLFNNNQITEIEESINASENPDANVTQINDAVNNSSSTSQENSSKNNQEINNSRGNGDGNSISTVGNGNNTQIVGDGDGNSLINTREYNYHNNQKEKEVRVIRGDGNNPVAIYSSPSGFADDMSNAINALPVLFDKEKNIVDATEEWVRTVFPSTITWLSGGTAVEELPAKNSLDNEGSEGISPQNKFFGLALKTTKVRVLEGEHKGMVGWVSSSVLKTEKRPIE
jgi:hypothetical protein